MWHPSLLISCGDLAGAVGVLLLSTEVAEEEHGNLVERAVNAIVHLRAPLGFSCALLTRAQPWEGDWPDASPPHPCTLVGRGGPGVSPAVCLQHSSAS